MDRPLPPSSMGGRGGSGGSDSGSVGSSSVSGGDFSYYTGGGRGGGGGREFASLRGGGGRGGGMMRGGGGRSFRGGGGRGGFMNGRQHHDGRGGGRFFRGGRGGGNMMMHDMMYGGGGAGRFPQQQQQPLSPVHSSRGRGRFSGRTHGRDSGRGRGRRGGNRALLPPPHKEGGRESSATSLLEDAPWAAGPGGNWNGPPPDFGGPARDYADLDHRAGRERDWNIHHNSPTPPGDRDGPPLGLAGLPAESDSRPDWAGHEHDRKSRSSPIMMMTRSGADHHRVDAVGGGPDTSRQSSSQVDELGRRKRENAAVPTESALQGGGPASFPPPNKRRWGLPLHHPPSNRAKLPDPANLDPPPPLPLPPPPLPPPPLPPLDGPPLPPPPFVDEAEPAPFHLNAGGGKHVGPSQRGGRGGGRGHARPFRGHGRDFPPHGGGLPRNQSHHYGPQPPQQQQPMEGEGADFGREARPSHGFGGPDDDILLARGTYGEFAGPPTARGRPRNDGGGGGIRGPYGEFLGGRGGDVDGGGCGPYGPAQRDSVSSSSSVGPYGELGLRGGRDRHDDGSSSGHFREFPGRGGRGGGPFRDDDGSSSSGPPRGDFAGRPGHFGPNRDGDEEPFPANRPPFKDAGALSGRPGGGIYGETYIRSAASREEDVGPYGNCPDDGPYTDNSRRTGRWNQDVEGPYGDFPDRYGPYGKIAEQRAPPHLDATPYGDFSRRGLPPEEIQGSGPRGGDFQGHEFPPVHIEGGSYASLAVKPTPQANTIEPPPTAPPMSQEEAAAPPPLQPPKPLDIPKPPTPPPPPSEVEEKSPSPPPSPVGPPSGVMVAFTRLADLESQMEFAYAKHMQLVRQRLLLRAQTDALRDLPVGVDAFKEDLDKFVEETDMEVGEIPAEAE